MAGRGRGAGEGGAEEAQPSATGLDDRHGPGGREAGDGSDRLGCRTEPVADRAVEYGEAGEVEGDPGRGGARLDCRHSNKTYRHLARQRSRANPTTSLPTPAATRTP